jgi:hypothetical protein
MYQAPIVAALIGVSIIWNKVGCALETKGWKIPLFMHHYGMMYAMLSYLFVVGCRSMYFDIMVPSQWLDADVTASYVESNMKANNEYNATYHKWEEESTLEEFQGLKEFSMLCPVWTALTLLVCIFHTHQHINRIRYDREGKPNGRKLVDCPEHNMTMTVLILPAVYGLMSFKSTCRMWLVMINHVPGGFGNHDTTTDDFSSYGERKTFLLEMYEANFMVGDIYETYALVTFGHLVMGVVNKKIKKMKQVFEQSPSSTIEMQQHIDMMLEAMQQLTIAGVQLFALSCFLQGAYNLIITTFAFDLPHIGEAYFSRKMVDGEPVGMFQQEAIRTMSHYFFLGAGFIASFAAINNLMTVEADFEEILEEFKPSLKFWGTKILVSLAFLQSILISVFLTPRGWSEVQSNLFYSSMLCLECLLIAVFHLKGWGANEEWYHDYEYKPEESKFKKSKTGVEEPFLSKANPNVPAESK